MVSDLSESRIYEFIVSDFEGAWNSIAGNPNHKIGRGNFMFANQAMNLLEFAARLYNDDRTGKVHGIFSAELNKIEPRYFTLLPSSCVGKNNEFILPHMGDTSGKTLLWVLFDLIRNGLAHQYQQIIVNLTDKKRFYVSLAIGAEHARYLNITAGSRPVDHLGYNYDNSCDLKLKVYPDTMYLDFKEAIHNSNLLEQGLSIKYLSRPRGPKPYYIFDTKSLEKNLVANNHIKF
jgi:hypothetical protein